MERQDNCVICFEKFGGEINVLPCRHAFHTACIKAVFEANPECPICRARHSNMGAWLMVPTLVAGSTISSAASIARGPASVSAPASTPVSAPSMGSGRTIAGLGASPFAHEPIPVSHPRSSYSPSQETGQRIPTGVRLLPAAQQALASAARRDAEYSNAYDRAIAESISTAEAEEQRRASRVTRDDLPSGMPQHIQEYIRRNQRMNEIEAAAPSTFSRLLDGMDEQERRRPSRDPPAGARQDIFSILQPYQHVEGGPPFLREAILRQRQGGW